MYCFPSLSLATLSVPFSTPSAVAFSARAFPAATKTMPKLKPTKVTKTTTTTLTVCNYNKQNKTQQMLENAGEMVWENPGKTRQQSNSNSTERKWVTRTSERKLAEQ